MNEEEEIAFILKNKDAHMPHMLRKFRILFDVLKISNAWAIMPEVVIKTYKDGRAMSPISECKSADIYEFEKSDNTNDKVDGFYPMESNLSNNLTIGVRCLTKGGVSFTQASWGQGHTKWKTKHVWLSQRVLNFQVVVDIVDFPIVYLTSCMPADIIYYTETKVFKKGVSRKTYYETMFHKGLEELIKDGEFINIDIYQKH
jgi:hypothetical protein